LEESTTTLINEKAHYFSFLLRLWRAGEDGKPIWRASLEDPLSGEHLGFASLKELFIYLENRTGEILFPSEDSPIEP
jgi:hypothetical protein